MGTAIESLLNRRFIILTGKGGVGKSTIAASVALAAAKAGKRTLLMQFSAYEKTGELLGYKGEIHHEMVEVQPNLFVVRPDEESAMREYALMVLRSERVYKAVFGNPLVSRLLQAAPGLHELLMLGKAFNHERERKHGRPVWDRIILDAPATGHSIYLFQVPFVLLGAAGGGLMEKELKRMVSLLQDPRRTVVHLVTLPEEMPVNETFQLRDELVSKMQMPMGAVIVNNVFSEGFDAEQKAGLKVLREVIPEDSDVLDRLVAAAIFRVDRCELQAQYITRLKEEMGLPLLEIPRYFVPGLGLPEVTDIAGRILQAAKGNILSAADPLPKDRK